MTDPEILAAAIAATRLSDRQFARAVLGIDPQTVSNWRRGVRPIGNEPTRRLLRLLAAHPRLWRELATGA
jgi:DNA-binding transcriptional regulator YiaG